MLYEAAGACHVGAVRAGSLGERAAESRRVPSSSADTGAIGPIRGERPRGRGRAARGAGVASLGTPGAGWGEPPGVLPAAPALALTAPLTHPRAARYHSSGCASRPVPFPGSPGNMASSLPGHDLVRGAEGRDRTESGGGRRREDFRSPWPQPPGAGPGAPQATPP